MKIHIIRLTDRDDSSDPQYFTIKTLRDQILNEWFDIWESMPSEETREKLKTDDGYLFDWMSEWGFDVEVVLTVTEKDF